MAKSGARGGTMLWLTVSTLASATGCARDVTATDVALRVASGDDSATAAATVLFSDSFTRKIPPDGGLGAQWTVAAGRWFADGRAISDHDGGDLAAETVAACADCTVQATVLIFGTAGGVYLRASSPSSADRYELVLLANADVQLRRVRAGVVTVLGQAPGGVAAPPGATVLALTASGRAPVTLTAAVDGTTQLTISDGSSAALAAGYAGLTTPNAGVWFDDFALTGAPPAGTPDLGVAQDLAVAAPDLAVAAPDLAVAARDLAMAAPDLAGGENPVVRENARPGTYAWGLAHPATNHEIEGYASLTSVPRGGEIRFFVRTPDPSFTFQIFRLGWYGGKGGRAMTSAVVLPSVAQPACPMDPTSGMTECNWSASYVLDVPAPPDPADWASGFYIARLQAGTSGRDYVIPFVVRDDSRAAPLAVQASFTTWQAYNAWGGKSLYPYNSPGGRAHMVSFNRPFDTSHVDGLLLSFVRFVEREGFDASYVSSLDAEEHGADLLRHRAFVSVGHDEYWSSRMRANVEAARDGGVNLAFFAANVCFWQVRFQPSPTSGAADRTMVCYKDATLDPVAKTNPELATVRWRTAPVNRPEDEMLGAMYQHDPVDADVVVIDTSHWIFAGSGLHDGDHLHRLLGNEVDGVFADIHPGLVRLGHSPYPANGTTSYADMTLYAAPSGAEVFAAGTIWWAYGVDSFAVTDRVSPAVQQITRNILDRFAQPR